MQQNTNFICRANLQSFIKDTMTTPKIRMQRKNIETCICASI